MNTYGYANQNVLSYYDPYGLWIPPSIPQWFVDGSAGFGDVLLFGQGQRLRDLANIDGGVDRCSKAYSVGKYTGYGVAAGIGGFGLYRGYKLGKEFSIGKNFRIAPFGNRIGHSIGRYPHYHRRGVNSKTGQTNPGQGIGRHRPWERKSPDRSFKDRF